MSNLHAHISRTAADCDGRYDSDYVIGLTAEEHAESQKDVNDFHDITFRERVACSIMSMCGNGNLYVVTGEHGYAELMEWNEQTDEGYVHTDARFCEDEACDPEAKRYRDHSAEAMGY